MDPERAPESLVFEWSSGWFASVPGWLSVFFIAVIIFAVVALVRDWQQDARECSPRDKPRPTPSHGDFSESSLNQSRPDQRRT